MRRPPTRADEATDAPRDLAEDLRRAIEGEVRFGDGDRALYATDSSSYRQVPIGVVVPRTVDDVVATVAVCRDHGAPVLPRGGGTSLAGQCCNVAVVLDFSKDLNRLQSIDRERKLAVVEPGIVLDVVRDAGEAGTPRLTFGPTPSTHDHCTIGGMLGNNACGNYSIMSEFYGAGPRMAHNVEELEVLTYDGLRLRVGRTSDDELDRLCASGGRLGQLYSDLRALRDRYGSLIKERFPDFPRRVSGYSLDGLLGDCGFDVAYALVGSEGTCVTILSATLRLVDSPPCRSVVIAGFEDVYAAAAQVIAAREHRPLALEGFDHELIEDNRMLGIHERELKLLPDGMGWLLAEFGGETQGEADAKADAFADDMRGRPSAREARRFHDRAAYEGIWRVRESGLGATAYVPGSKDTYEGWEDSAVPPEELPDYLRGLHELFDRFGYDGSLYGHFGQGCVHTRIDWDPHTAEGVRTWRRFLDAASDLVLAHGGSLSGEHGDGQSRAELLEKMYGSELVGAFREFKGIFDPDGKMNPGKVVDPYPITSNLRLGPQHQPVRVRTRFHYERDHGDFTHAADRCVGVGTCRHHDGGVMCPSYMVTREERHSTRGRARLLHEMLRRDSPLKVWRSNEVKEALDLCLSCKGCKSDCPVNVDMATYKAEFLFHHYRWRPRPRAAYAMGLIPWWARAAAKAPALVNLVTSTPALAHVLRSAGGIDQRRPIPKFASRTFLSWFARRDPGPARGPEVLLWPDTFTNFLHPHVGIAATEVLESAGFTVRVPSRPVCCGRPLYDYGMLTLAERTLRHAISSLEPWIRAGTPVVGLEPSCVAVFRDELPDLLHGDRDAARLCKQTVTLAEFLEQCAPEWSPGVLEAGALLHGHCHQRAVMGLDAECSVLRRTGTHLEVLDAGCCGLAGSFGFEAGEKYDVSVKAAERKLLPAVRAAAPDTLVVADGFSCRTQLQQLAGVRALHTAEFLQLAGRTREEATRTNDERRERVAQHA